MSSSSGKENKRIIDCIISQATRLKIIKSRRQHEKFLETPFVLAFPEFSPTVCNLIMNSLRQKFALPSDLCIYTMAMQSQETTVRDISENIAFHHLKLKK